VLSDILSFDIYRFFMIFSRIGAMMMLLPGIGGKLLPARGKMILGLALTLLLLPLAGPLYPPRPKDLGALFLMVGSEAMIGFYLGSLTQVLLSSLHVAGTFIGSQIGLTNAYSFDFIAEQQSATLTALLTNIALVAIFSTDLHHLMLQAMFDSYATFVPGQPLPLGDFIETLSHLMADSFGFAIKLSAPILAFGLIFYVGLGLLSRLSPQIQVFFIALPLQLIGGLWMLMVAMPLMVFLFLRWFEGGLMPFVLAR
jgi:flagellar biosynthetic protein FliR